MEVLQPPSPSSPSLYQSKDNTVSSYGAPMRTTSGKKLPSSAKLPSSNACVGNFKKRMAPQPPKPIRIMATSAGRGVTESSKNKIEDSYSTMSTMSVNSSSPNSTVSEKSIKVKPIRKPLPRKEVEPTTSMGWIRIYCGPDRSDLYANDDPNRILQVNWNVSVKEITMGIMDLPLEYTIWLQIGGVRTRRLRDTEYPLQIQENFLKKLGFHNEFRRSRMGIDVDLKWLIRFHIGPAEFDTCRGLSKSGNVEVLKGLVSPQWKCRTVAIVGSKLIIFPGEFLLYYK